MKLCASPANTTCVYQRIARDQADPDDGAQAAQAYEELCKFLADHLDPNDLGEAEALLRQFVDQTDEPVSGRPRPGGMLSMDEMHRRVAVSAQIRARQVQAQTAALEKRFPDAKRLRVIG